MFLQINDVDFSKNVQESTYKVDSIPVYEEWTDAGKKIHREITRNRVVGSFDIVFFDGWGQSIDDFYTAINTIIDEGVTKVKLYISNLNQTKNVNAFLTISTNKYVPNVNGKTLHRLNIKVEER